MHVPIYKDPVSLNSNQFLLVTYTKTKFQHKLLSGSSMDTEVKSLMRMSRIKFDKSSFVLIIFVQKIATGGFSHTKLNVSRYNTYYYLTLI